LKFSSTDQDLFFKIAHRPPFPANRLKPALQKAEAARQAQDGLHIKQTERIAQNQALSERNLASR
jgi:hypothetical protein